MNTEIYSNDVLIGVTNFVVGDETMGHVYGILIPNQNYYQLVQQHVWDFYAANKPNYVKWKSLKFSVRLPNGYFLYPEGGVTIDHFEEFKTEPIQINLAGVGRMGIEMILNNSIHENFLLEPWETISIHQKIAFENELVLELNSQHPLYGKSISALCKFAPKDEVLFQVEHSNKPLAVVHLTHSRTEEQGGFPRYYEYNDFEDFRKIRMEPDYEEYNL